MRYPAALVALTTLQLIVTPAQAQDTIKYGLGVALTGPIGFMGTQYSKGLQAGLDYVNSQGGIDGKKFEVIVRDTKGLPSEAVTVAKRLIELDKTPVIDITLPGSATLASQSVSKDAKVPMLGYTTVPAAVDQGNPFYFRPYSNVNIISATLAKVIGELKNDKRVALLASNDDYGRSAVQVMTEALKSYPDVKIVFSDYYERTQTDFSAIFLRMKAANADTLYLDIRYPQSVTALKQMAEVGLKGTVVNSLLFYNNELAQRAGPLLEGAYITALWAPIKDDPESKKFIEAFRKTNNGETPDDSAAAGWCSAMVIADAFKRAGANATGDKLRAAIAATNIASPIGQIKFNQKGDAEAPVLLLQYRNGAYHPL